MMNDEAGIDKLSREDLLDMAIGLPPPEVSRAEWEAEVRKMKAGEACLWAEAGYIKPEDPSSR